MNIARTLAALAALGLGAASIPPAAAQQPSTALKIGVLSDFQSVYADIGGTGNVEATKMAMRTLAAPCSQADRPDHRRRPQQGRCRRFHGAQMVRERGRRQ